MNLNNAKIGVSYIVDAVTGEDRDRLHLLEMGLIPGTIVEIVKRAPMGDPVEIRLHGYDLAIRVNQAKKVEVTPAAEACSVFDDASNIKNNNPYNLKSFSDCNACNQCGRCDHFKLIAEGIDGPDIVANISNDTQSSSSGPITSNNSQHPGLGEEGRFHNKNDENPLPEDKIINFALVGNQNCGKTTLFNQLTGSNQHVGNFPGVTVDRKDGTIIGHKNTNITDLPGVYSLVPYSKEEEITRDMVLSKDIDCIINIVDATSIERSLYLTMQLMELNKPLVVALNMMDELVENGGTVDVNLLEENLGVPIVPISALKNQGIEELVDHAIHIAKYQEVPARQDFCASYDRGGAIHRSIHAIMHGIEDHAINTNTPIRFAATMLAMRDYSTVKRLKLDKNEQETNEHIVKQMEAEANLDAHACIAEMRYKFIMWATSSAVKYADKNAVRERSVKADKILTGKWTAIPAFIVIMLLVFFLTFDVIGSFLQNIIAAGLSSLSSVTCQWLGSINASPVVHSFIEDGLFAGVGSVLSFMPIIIVLFFFLSIMEDSGYVARVAFFMDKLLRKIGLSGRSIVPMLIGFGCSVPAIMSTRTLPSERDRRLTILLTPFMSCSAKLPIYVFISAIFFPGYAPIVVICLYLLGIVTGVIVALFLKGKGQPVPFIMELPNYRMPSAKNVGLLLWEKCSDFLKKAFGVILIATIIIWFLQNFDFGLTLVENSEDSILACLAGFIAPIFIPLGLGDWKIVTSLITGFIAKESVVSTMAVLYGGADAIAAVLTPLLGIVLLVFCLLYTPCVASIAAVRRELGGKYAIAVVVFQCVVAYVVAFLIRVLICIIMGIPIF